MTTRTLLSGALALAATLAATTAAAQPPITSVKETGGEYVVSATFTVAAPAHVAREVLTDYANIPRFMPDVRTSVVIEREDGHVRVEQEAVPKFMWFSREIYLTLDIDEGVNVIRFRDRGNRSFVRYEGSWTITTLNGQTQLAYDLTARPAFDVPGFVLRKLFKRDAVAMADRLRAEIDARALAE